MNHFGSPAPDRADRASVYVLVRHDRRRFKLGWARNPMRRARCLVEFQRGELDLAASRAIWLPTRPRAEQVERSLHKTLAPYSVEPDHQEDGNREWFAGHAQDTALRMLGQMPLQSESALTARVLPLTMAVAPADAVCIETGPQDTWWRLEDLLARLAMHCPVSVQVDVDGAPVLAVLGMRRYTAPDFAELRSAALDSNSYQCWSEGRPRAFVQTIAWQGDDLVLTFTAMRVIERWDEGLELVGQVRGLLARLRRVAPLRGVA